MVSLALGTSAFAVVQSQPPESEPTPTPSQAPPPPKTEPVGAWFRRSCDEPPGYIKLLARGYYPGRSPDVVMTANKPDYFGSFAVTSHSGPWRYVQRVPLVFYGPGYVKSGGQVTIDGGSTVADLAPTVAELLDHQLPGARAGRVLDEVLVPAEERPTPPALVVVVVWDGGGWNVLEEWPRAWGHLKSLTRRGTSVTNAMVGSSPSVTPAVHATMGTGAFPDAHGIIDIPLRDGDRIVDSYQDDSPRYLAIETLADSFDQATGNASLIGTLAERSWHLGMIGHGAFLEGADKDIAVLMEGEAGGLTTNPDLYVLPDYLEGTPGLARSTNEVDLEDGVLDNTWQGHAILDDPEKLTDTPAWTLYQEKLIERLLAEEDFGQDDVPDLFFTNFKQLDEVGHIYNMIETETRSTLKYSDIALRRLTEFLNESVGTGRWVMAVTADHGQGPDPSRTGAWPITMTELKLDLAAHFDTRADALIAGQRPTGIWLKQNELNRLGITDQDIANFLVNYRVRANITPETVIPSGYQIKRRRRVLSSAFPYRYLEEVAACSREGL